MVRRNSRRASRGPKRGAWEGNQRLRKLWKAGDYIDVPRHFVPPEEPFFTWWGYRFPQSFQKNYGWHLDHILASPNLAPEIAGMTVVTDTRTWDRPSDHVPVMVDLA